MEKIMGVNISDNNSLSYIVYNLKSKEYEDYKKISKISKQKMFKLIANYALKNNCLVLTDYTNLNLFQYMREYTLENYLYRDPETNNYGSTYMNIQQYIDNIDYEQIKNIKGLLKDLKANNKLELVKSYILINIFLKKNEDYKKINFIATDKEIPLFPEYKKTRDGSTEGLLTHFVFKTKENKYFITPISSSFDKNNTLKKEPNYLINRFKKETMIQIANFKTDFEANENLMSNKKYFTSINKKDINGNTYIVN
jgi:hypothetical protein